MEKFRTSGLIAAALGVTWFVYYRIEHTGAGCCWPETIISSVVISVLTFAIVMGLTGRWRPLVGAVPTGLIAFALTAPSSCTHMIADGVTDSYESLNCTSLIGFKLPSYLSAEPVVDPPLWPALLIGFAVAGIAYLISRRQFRLRNPQ